MAGFLCTEGLPRLLNNGISGTYTVRLFTAPSIVNQDAVFADFVEATFPGYSPVGGFSFNTAIGGSGSNATANWMDFADFREDADASISENVVGYYVEQSDGTCLGAEVLSADVTFQYLGDAVRIMVVLSFGACVNCP